ncbi:MAG: hypothetical protein HYS63_02855 [Methylocystis sp.]|nr:hypothetical protein [Methylocystis sp.]
MQQGERAKGFLILSVRSTRLEGRGSPFSRIFSSPSSFETPPSISGLPEIDVHIRKSGKPDLRAAQDEGEENNAIMCIIAKTILHTMPLLPGVTTADIRISSCFTHSVHKIDDHRLRAGQGRADH